MANKDDAHYWELVRVEMDNVYKMHLATVERSHSIIRQWGVVAAFPFVVMSFARVDGSLRIDLTGYIQDGGWVFFVAAGLFS
ncbi:MAG: hypothetical protein LBG71_04330, partial [Clostridiales Family XIII bacterium]|nr:hypothetical protein [Clostridiales Family XIII bacterium]